MTNDNSENRVGRRSGKVSELTVIAPLKPGGAAQMRAGIDARTSSGWESVDRMGTVHDMRYVFIDNDTKILFATTYDGDWDTYIDDFATKIPQVMDQMFGAVEGWPGITSPTVKDFIAQHQITAAAWYVANDATVSEVRKAVKVTDAFANLLDLAN